MRTAECFHAKVAAFNLVHDSPPRVRKELPAGLSLNVTDQIIKLTAAESLPVVDRHGVCSFPLDRDQTGLHQQVKLATCVLQLQRGVIFISNHAGKLSAIARHGCNRLGRFRGRPEDRVANCVSRMISRKPGEVSDDELSSTGDLVAGGTSGLANEKISASRRIAGHGVPGGPALQKADISDERVSIFFAKTGKRRHPCFGNSIVHQVKQFLVRQRLRVAAADDIWSVLTAEPVETVAGRALCLVTALSFQVGACETRGGLNAVRILAKNSAARAERNQRQPKLENDSPSHVTRPGFGASEEATLRASDCVPLHENKFLGIGDIGR